MAGVGFAVGTGRCGTKFLAEVLARDPEIASHHERNPFNDTFYRYCKWYGFDVDPAGFLAVKRRGIEEDLRKARYSFEASGFLSLALEELHNAFGAQIVAMVRRPNRVVASYLQKGWYENEPILDDPNRPPTKQQVAMPHHFLGRTMPKGAEFERWRSLTRVGKIAWYWSRLNRALVEQAEKLPKGAVRFQKLGTLDYAAYRELCGFLGAPANLTEAQFASKRERPANASKVSRRVIDWDATERAEFEAEVREMAEYFDYPWSTEEIAARQHAQPQAPRGLFDGVRPALKAARSRFVAQAQK